MKRLTKAAARKILGEEKAKAIKTLASRKPATTPAPAEPDYGENTVINHPTLENSKIIFVGKNNILYCEKGVTLTNSKIMFCRSNSVIYLSAGPKARHTSLNIAVSHNSAVFIGSDTNFHASKEFRAHIVAQEQKHVIIGNDCIFSLNCWLRTSDAHAAYDAASKRRLNPSRSIVIGDHVWIGQDVTMLKGSKIGSGSIIGAGSVVPGKPLESNASCAGNPAKPIKSGIFFDRRDMNHANKENETYTHDDANNWIYEYDASSTLTPEKIDADLTAAKTSKAKLAYIQKHLVSNGAKNRFYIGPENSEIRK